MPSSPDYPSGQDNAQASDFTPALRISFAGLMVFHQLSSPRLQEVGILQGVHEHVFSIQLVTTSAGGGTTTTSIPVQDYIDPKHYIWELKVGTHQPTISQHRPGTFSRTDPLTDPEHADWLIDLESHEISPKTAHPLGLRHPERLLPVIHIDQGRYHTLTRTCPLEISRNQTGTFGPFRPFGMVGMYMAIDINAGDNEEFVLQVRKSPPQTIFRQRKEPGNTYHVLINNQIQDDPLPTDPDHFQHYYDLFDPMERVQFRVPDPSACKIEREEFIETAKPVFRAPYPYKCSGINLSARTGPLRSIY
ncbi:MAG: hypothetical protein ACJ74J_23750 [Blastocatellia bacterium]